MKFVNHLEKETKTDLILLLSIYSVSFFFMLINMGVFWDDWVLYNMSPTIIIDTFKQQGYQLTAYIHNILLSVGNGVTSYRILTFFAYFFSAVFLYFILTTIKEIARFDRMMIVLLFAILPVNSARIALINAPSATYHFFFWFGFWLISRYLKERKIVFKLIALLFFFLSFRVRSLLVFYVIVLLFVAYSEFRKRKPAESKIKQIAKHLDLLLLPIVYWLVQGLFFKPYGLYEGYNQLSFKKIIVNIKPILKLSYDSFQDLVDNLFVLHSPVLVILVAILIFLLLTKRLPDVVNPKKSAKISFLFMGIGIILLFLAIFPYTVVYKMPQFWDWNSRFQLLFPLGVSFILIFGVKILLPFSKPIKMICYSLLISLFTINNASYYIDFQKDWYKQAALIENIKSSSIIRENTTFLFDDATEDLNANGRTYRFYEYSGLMKYAFGDERRFGFKKHDFVAIDNYKKCFSVHYSMKDYKMKNPEFVVAIDYGPLKLNCYELARLKFLELFSKEKFKKSIRDIVKLNYQEL